MKYCAALLLILLFLTCPVLADTWIANCSAGLIDQEGAEVRVNTVPDGALVTIDNNPLGTTPYQENIGLKGFTYGAHTLVLTKPGYETATVRFGLCIPYITDVRVDLQPVTPVPTPVPVVTTATPGRSRAHAASSTVVDDPVPGVAALVTSGSLKVTTDPAGAEVILDEGARIGISPVTFDGLTPGTHSLLMRKQGYSDSTVLVSITIAEEQAYAATLRPSLPGTGTTTASAQKTQYTPGFVAVSGMVALGSVLLLRKN